MEWNLYLSIVDKIESLETEIVDDFSEYIESLPDAVYDAIVRHVSLACYESIVRHVSLACYESIDDGGDIFSLFPPRICLH